MCGRWQRSSIIDVLVYLERCKERRVYLDYRRNPRRRVSYDELEPEARDYRPRRCVLQHAVNVLAT
ncbi:MAG: hypothetical protein ACLRI7_03145 [Ruthenibacterium lactatiformans]